MTSSNASTPAGSSAPVRIASIDALRGLIMFIMIVVNDLSDVSDQIVPAWLKHYRGPNGMTFVDLVFPAFLFIVGMSIPFGLGSRLDKGEARWKIAGHVIVRTLSLLFIGIMMVNGTPDAGKMGWSGDLWVTVMFLSAIFAFCVVSPSGKPGVSGKWEQMFKVISQAMRGIGLVMLVWLAFEFRTKKNGTIITLSPFSLHHIWYGILGYIGWAYLVASTIFLIFRNNRTALVACLTMVMCLYPAAKQGMFEHLWLAKHINFGIALGSRAAIAVAGLLLGSILVSADTRPVAARVRFTLWFIAGCAAAAWLVTGLYGISKDNGTPAWCLWGCALTAALWLVLYFLTDVQPVSWLARPLAIAGQNVLLAYLLSEMLPSLLACCQLAGWYNGLTEQGLAFAIIRAAGCAVVILMVTAGLNRAGFRLRL